MIEHISIKNFAVIKSLELDLYPGLNIITGETGAGKSVVIEAVSMALGSRADSDYIRTGEDRASIEIAVSGLSSDVKKLLSDEGIPDEEPLILKRELISSGRSFCRINGSMVPLSLLSKVSLGLCDIHGQYDHQYLLDPENHIYVLDLFGGKELSEAASAAGEWFRQYSETRSELYALTARLNSSRREKELLTHELSEIEAAAIRPGEEAELSESLSLMQNSEKIFEALSEAYGELYGDSGSADSAMGTALTKLQSVSGYSSELEALSKSLEDIYYQADELRAELRHQRDRISFSPSDMDAAADRLEIINSLKRKYGGSEESIVSYADRARESLALLEDSDSRIAGLEKKAEEALRGYKIAAEKLSLLRKRAGAELSEKVNKELLELNFRSSDFVVSLKPGEMSEQGSDICEFLISANRGEAAKPLSKVASGGELSRIMLALKRITGDMDSVPTMIFDEIDTGISGASAGVVGIKLKSISKGHQVVCITHLPQIACLGDRHYRIEKTSDEQGTYTDVVPLDHDGRIEELARLLSGTSITDAARVQAAELLAGAGK